MQTILLDVPVQRNANDNYAESMREYNKLTKNGKVFLCYCRKNKQYYVSVYFSREFLEDKKVTIVM